MPSGHGGGGGPLVLLAAAAVVLVLSLSAVPPVQPQEELPGSTFLQPVPDGHRAPLDLRPRAAGSKAPLVAAAVAPEFVAAPGGGRLPSLPLFAAMACAAAAVLRAQVMRRAKGKPQTTSGVRVRKPKNNALRNTSIATFEELTTRGTYKPLCFMYKRRFARPRHKGIMMATKTGRESGHKYRKGRTHARMYRIIDFGRTKRGMWGEIMSIEYDPYRNSRICLVRYEDGEMRYILHAMGYYKGQQILADAEAPVFVGNAMPLDKVPIGTMVHNIERQPSRGGALARAAGTSAIVLSRDYKHVTVKLPSSEVRLLKKMAWCTIGKVGRTEHQLIKLGKAGKSRQLGIRPHVRGSAKNAVEHPHGGGEGRSPIGHKYQKTIMGKCALGLRTRRRPKKNLSTKMILIRRKKKSGRPE